MLLFYHKNKFLHKRIKNMIYGKTRNGNNKVLKNIGKKGTITADMCTIY